MISPNSIGFILLKNSHKDLIACLLILIGSKIEYLPTNLCLVGNFAFLKLTGKPSFNFLSMFNFFRQNASWSVTHN